ncbi:4-coumarate--CoA ligase 1-like [Photinus pyralis]|nr:4-coumarate--CoA ligase 1-like [Photinus pyralis]
MALTKVTHLKKLLALRERGKEWRSFSSKIIYSKVSNVEVPKLSINDYVWKDLDKWSDKIAMECAETGRSYSYADVYKKSNKVANFLANFPGLSEGDVIATMLPNVPEYAIIFLGAVQAGYKITSLNPVYTRDELLHCIGISKPKLIFTLTDLWSHIYRVTERSKVPIVVMNHTEEVMDIPAGAIKLSEVFENTSPSQNRTRDWNDVIYLPYSSGTTGLFKCIELTNANIVSSVHHNTVPEFKMTAPTDAMNQDMYPAILPISHISGTLPMFCNMSWGCKAITFSKVTTQLFLKALQNTSFTHCYLVPSLIQMLASQPCIKPEHLARMRSIQVGGAPLDVRHVQTLTEKLNGKMCIYQVYGLSEGTGGTHFQTPHIPGGVKIGSCGLSGPNTEFRIQNADGEMLGSNESGTIYLRGLQIFKGYLNDAEATQSTLDSEGWLNTGDVGHYDEDGHLFVTSRLKELIKVKGFQVAPAEIEAILRSHPDVSDALVVGIPHQRFGEVPKAFIVTKSPSSVNLKNIEEFVASKVARHKHLLGGIVVTENIPRTALGKLLRRKGTE